MKLEIPVGAPLVYELDEQLRPVRRYYLGAGLVAAPPLGVALLLASGAGGAEEEGGGRQEGEGLEGMAAARCAMQALAAGRLAPQHGVPCRRCCTRPSPTPTTCAWCRRGTPPHWPRTAAPRSSWRPCPPLRPSAAAATCSQP